MKSVVYLIVIGAALSACKTTQKGSFVKSSDLTCTGGDVVAFTLTKQEELSYPTVFTFPEFPSLEFRGVPPESERQAQIDLCYRDETNFSVVRVRLLEGPVFFDVKEPQMLQTDGLAEALFGDSSNLNVIGKFPIQENASGPGYFILRSWKSGGVTFVGFGAGRIRSGAPIYYGNDVIAGSFLPGEGTFPQTSSECGFNETLKESTFKIDTVKFQMKSCEYLTIDRSTAIRPIWTTIADDNPDAGGTISHEWNKPEDFKQPDGGFQYIWSHHNMHDEIHIRLKEAAYDVHLTDFPPGTNQVDYEAKYKRTGKTVTKTLQCESLRSCP
ncbi:MAG: hypothetical protein AB7T49_04430 [Oligoflexales bacterium]